MKAHKTQHILVGDAGIFSALAYDGWHMEALYFTDPSPGMGVNAEGICFTIAVKPKETDTYKKLF